MILNLTSLFPYFLNALLYTFIRTMVWVEAKHYYKTSTVQVYENAFRFSNFHLNSVKMTTTKGIRKTPLLCIKTIFNNFQQKVLDSRVLGKKTLGLISQGFKYFNSFDKAAPK